MVDLNDWEDSLLDNNVQEPIQEEIEEDPTESYEDNVEEDDLLDTFLKSRGINPDSIKVETENGIEEFSFNDLSREEQMSILNEQPQKDDTELTEDEIDLINKLRSNNWTQQDYNNYIAQQAINSQQSEDSIYNIDDYSDDELFIMDLQAKIPDITEDEAVEELANAKTNENLFAKRISSLREEYKNKEDEERRQLESEQQAVQQQQMEQFKDTVLNTIENNREIDLGGISLEMSDDDMNTVASFILDSDQAGVRHIAKALNDPNNIFQFAWWITKGQDAFRQLNDYYKRQITQVAKNNYNRGVEDAKSGNVNSVKSVVRKPRKSNKSQNNDGDLYDDLI